MHLQVLYDECMELLYNPAVLDHETVNHPESADRLAPFVSLPVTQVSQPETILELIHTKEYIAEVKEKSQRMELLDPDTQTSPGSFHAALTAAALTIHASEIDNFALVRPPGHHAYPDHGAGFCLFNNIAIATQQAVNSGKRVLILDIDGHLGDGTEAIFYPSKNVLYWSLHQEHAYPEKGAINEIGIGEGIGYTINVPLPAKAADDIYMQAFNRILPITLEFAPDIVGVSAGFDAHVDDPTLQLKLSTNTYYQIGSTLAKHFPHTFAVLEGGYNSTNLEHCIYSFLDGVNTSKNRYEEPSTETPFLLLEQFQIHLDSLVDTLKPYWKSLV